MLAVMEKELRMFFRYPLRVVSSIIVGIVFLVQFIFFGQAVLGGRYSSMLAASTGMGDYPTYALIGYVLWWLFTSPIEAYIFGIRRELQRGTLEINMLAPLRTIKFLIGLSLGWILIDNVLMGVVFLFGVCLFKIPLSWGIILKAVPIFMLAFVAFLGFGMIFAGLVMLFKNIGALGQIFEFLVMFLSGVFFPLNVMPYWVRAVGNAIPLTHAINIVRGVFVGKSYAEMASSLQALLLLSTAYWLISYGIFRWAEKITRVVGYGGY
ncbi:ABC transporter permease [Thermococci archaeon]|nr:MAG: ABC transporter permease [Thermococci archaeon]